MSDKQGAWIPGAMRGYVQIALDRGVLQAFPADFLADEHHL